MLKKVYGTKFSRNTKSRIALFRALIVALILNGKIKTTKAKAKAIQGDVDKLIRIASVDTLANRKLVLSKLANNEVITKKLFIDSKELSKNRKSGFTRLINLPNRKGDGAEISRLELVK